MNNPTLLLALEAAKEYILLHGSETNMAPVIESIDAALNELAQVEPVAWSTIADDHPYKRLTDLKTADIASRGYEVTGYVLRNGDDNVCISECSAVRWMDAKEMFSMMHPESQAVSREGWQAIETAPEGQDVLLFDGSKLFTGKSKLKVLQKFAPIVESSHWYVWEYWPKPTHWHELPAAPIADTDLSTKEQKE